MRHLGIPPDSRNAPGGLPGALRVDVELAEDDLDAVPAVEGLMRQALRLVECLLSTAVAVGDGSFESVA